MEAEPLPHFVRIYRYDDWHSRHAKRNTCYTCGKSIQMGESVVSKTPRSSLNKIRHAECAVRVNLITQEQLEAALN